MILIAGDESVFEQLPRTEQDVQLAKHYALQEELRASGKLVGAARLMAPDTAVTVSRHGDKVLVTDGPFSETKEQVLGFYLLEADSMEEAVEAAKMLPLETGHLEVRPVRRGGPSPGDDGT